MPSAMDKRLLTIREIEFPLTFSPTSTSTPDGKKIRNVSFLSSSSGSEDGNITGRAVRGVDESLIDDKSICKDFSLLSIQTAIEYIDPSALRPKKSPLSHALVRSALETCAAKTWSCKDSVIFAEIALQRYLWDENTNWKSCTYVEDPEKILKFLTKKGMSTDYIKNSIGFTYYKIMDISKVSSFSKENVKNYFVPLGIPSTIIDRLFDGVVTKRKKNLLDIADLSQFIFALYGVDDIQSIEYWFRILDTDGLGYLDECSLKIHYDEVQLFLNSIGVVTLEFSRVFEMFSEILGSNIWTLSVLKKTPKITVRVLTAFMNSLRFYDFETNEKMNTEREDDELFGMTRNCWRREIDHAYDSFYDEDQSQTSSIQNGK